MSKKFYQITTRKFCGGITVNEDGLISFNGTAPCFKWAARKKMTFSSFILFLKKKKDLINCKKLEE